MTNAEVDRIAKMIEGDAAQEEINQAFKEVTMLTTL